MSSQLHGAERIDSYRRSERSHERKKTTPTLFFLPRDLDL